MRSIFFPSTFPKTNFLSLSICIPPNARHELMNVHDKELLLNDANLYDFLYSRIESIPLHISYSHNGCVWNFSIKTFSAQISKPFHNNKCVTHFASLTTNSNICNATTETTEGRERSTAIVACIVVSMERSMRILVTSVSSRTLREWRVAYSKYLKFLKKKNPKAKVGWMHWLWNR